MSLIAPKPHSCGSCSAAAAAAASVVSAACFTRSAASAPLQVWARQYGLFPMAGRVGNKTWLRQQLQKALQWDADAAEAVVEAVVASTPDEVRAGQLASGRRLGLGERRCAAQNMADYVASGERLGLRPGWQSAAASWLPRGL